MSVTTYTRLFTRGTKSAFSTLAASDGKIRFITDSQELYIDYGSSHIKICDIIMDYDESTIKGLSSPLTNKIYLASDNKHFYLYNTSTAAWVDLTLNHIHTPSQVGLGNVGNFKAVSTVANQGLTSDEKAAARDNIGAGTSSFSGAYSDLSGLPTLGTAAALNIAESGDASSTEVVIGGDSRLSDSRPASDVYDWAKASTKPTYTASEVGLGNVGNFKAVSTVASQGLTDEEKGNARANIGAGTSSFSGAYSDLSGLPTIPPAVSVKGNAETEYRTGEVNITPANIGLTNVDNTSDATKKSNFTGSIADGNTGFVTGGAAYTALADKLDTSLKGANNGLAELDSSGKVPTSQLPSFVDDVIEYNSKNDFPASGETGKIYVAKDTNLTYRWGGTEYVEISPSLALGETDSTAYRGDRGKTAYDHSQSTHARTDATNVTGSSTNGNIVINGTETNVYTHPSGTNPHGTTKSDVGLGNVGNFKAVSTVASQGLSTTEQANARANIGAGTSSLTLGNDATNAYYGDKGKIAYDHSQSTHARTDATNVTGSSTNGNIKINGTETNVYTHPSGTNPHGTTKSDVGLGNVGNFKAVSTEASQGLSSTEQSNARANIGLSNVDNTSDSTKKSNFTGSIAQSNTGFVTGGAVWSALDDLDFGEETLNS